MRSRQGTLRKVPAPVPELVSGGAEYPDEFSDVFVKARRQFLDALPVPGALVGEVGGAIQLVDCNVEFRSLGDATESILEDPAIAPRLALFLAGDEPIANHSWLDGDPITGREYTVRFARLRLAMTDAPACLVTLLDRTAERSAEKSLRLEMFHDSLTGLVNRAGFSDELERVLSTAEPGKLAVLAIDLARFSRINESIGSLSGDELLITVARRLLSTMRGGDVLGRTGGNEFGVVVRVQDGPDEAGAVAQRLAGVLTKPCRLSELEIRVDCAIGCAVLEPGCDGDELIRRAQFALKRAKVTGETEIYQPRAFDIARHQFSIETALRRAIEADRLALAFQPVIDLANGRAIGFEALARWREDGVDIPPATFIPVAEESGLILPLGRWALDAALRTLADWDRRTGTADVRMAVNVSAIQIARDDVPKMVQDALTAHDIKSGRLTLELTESAIIADPERAAVAMMAVRAIGATLALDDFGTGYSNLAYLQRLPIDVLKIDQSFVTGMLGDRDKIAIVRAILSLAETLGLNTTAEGVETSELSRTLAALGCTSGQGYFYSPPLTADAAYAFWLRSRSAAT
jgi:diguanylate cyclase (GGDEF)-like protein